MVNYLIIYTSKIPIKMRKKHIFDDNALYAFHEKMLNQFNSGVELFTKSTKTRFKYEEIIIDLRGINGFFWKFCTINKIFDSLGYSISFTRVLHDLLENIDRFKKDLKYKNSEISRKSKQARKVFASNGGLAKARKYREQMNPIFDQVFILFQGGNPNNHKRWKSKSECAKYFIKEFYLKNPETEIDLDPKKLVFEITNRINDQDTSRKVTFLADR